MEAGELVWYFQSPILQVIILSITIKR